ncbi:hypothetical protein [Herbiconiux liangxiaofengii]|uniref:hypothetical protein n=1 Tax=Herbiconiux liangxiaofengii TaxID=3342795 RepID=UPI0035B788AA
MTTVVLSEKPSKTLATPLKGVVFVLFWIIALALWIVAPHMTDPRWGAFLIDSGIVFASVGFAATQVGHVVPLRNSLLAGVAALALFALGDFGEVTVLSYFLRIIVPLLALYAALFAVVARVKIWYS